MANGKQDKPFEKKEDDETPKRKRGPLTLDEFRTVLETTKSLGLSWTADIPPDLISKKKESGGDDVVNEDLLKLIRKFPKFPLELGSVIHYVLTGKTIFDAGPKDLRDQKAKVVTESEIITAGYRSEYFFKHATKVPYFKDLDWEVVIKEYERGVVGTPAMSYALLSLKIENPRGPYETRMRNITVAVNQALVEELISTLTDVSKALQKSSTIATAISHVKFEVKGEIKDVGQKTN